METIRQHPAQTWPLARSRRRLRIAARWLSLTLLVVVLTVAAFILVLHPPAGHVRDMAFYLALAGLGSLVLGEGALWAASAARFRNIRLQLAIPPVLTALVIACTVIALGQAMFLSSDDTRLLLIFLAFAVFVALALAWSIASEMARSIARLEIAARRIAQGDYGFRVPDDNFSAAELSRLARWFNAMAANVQEAFAKQHTAESERRQVLAAVSHDLRTPLASIRAMIEAIDDGVATDPATVRRYQHTIRAEVRRLATLMDELFELSRLDSGALKLEYERLGIEDLISDALEAFHEQAAQAGVRLEGSVADGLPPIMIDPRQISRILANLLQNALSATPSGGAIFIRARQAQPDALLVEVLDTGTGIAPGDLPHIFERTYRGEVSRTRNGANSDEHAPASGAGLGLAIARGIVELHGGRIWAVSPLPTDLRAALIPLLALDRQSEPFAGTALCFTLPSDR
ncbi:MAG: hypothetical protein OJF49_003855 [Ktedonobacterales bacterium]|jgi:signal transduction histidine kinase|nr:MAG: hypothetical protein OJF49_003855 [Ktedonobacterales bacterium]